MRPQGFLERLLQLAYDEDLGAAGDVTTMALVPEHLLGEGELVAKEALVFSGAEAFLAAFAYVDKRVEVQMLVSDAQRCGVGACLARVRGPMRALLVAERTALNLVQRTSGIATFSAKVREAVEGTKLRVVDTRKTSPGLRMLSKQAVRHGGLHNHRFGLFDGILIKDNHLAALGGNIREAVARAKQATHGLLKIEVEVSNLQGLQEAIAAGADVVMLDNMGDEEIERAIAVAAGRILLEVSGQVSVERLSRLAAWGVDWVSMGALTHSARAVDLSLNLRPTP
ncbi:MAG: carboxylating nicotinate-nucleotide diphosphorylase [Proteobacteria bacterium]|nr:carboxylating nicotinate-nucleotide diphosphorylase [Cystobacterineae bacterium]MCL2258987.1 carboxylating nicotinate-nucleotide diphosphorylase [Cystobacterineae bacterium]MCL2313715.1 carboxylating nicotinate-nucleotide diphosphorylase [Pseudomonadota bacterium]